MEPIKFVTDVYGQTIDQEYFNISFFFEVPYEESHDFSLVVDRAKQHFSKQVNGKDVSWFMVHGIAKANELVWHD